MNKYTLQDHIESDLREAAEWANEHGEEFTRDDIDTCIDETIDRALFYTRVILSLWDSFGNPEPTELADTLSNSILYAVVEAIHESDVVANAINEAGLEDIYYA